MQKDYDASITNVCNPPLLPQKIGRISRSESHLACADEEVGMATTHGALALKISFYISANLKEWVFASSISNLGWHGNQYECPNLVAAPVEGSNSEYVLEYFPGSFNGHILSPRMVGKTY